MAWRNWSVIAILVLANYLVFSTLSTVVFPPTPITAPTHAVKPTFTPGAAELRAVGTLTYDFLTPTATALPTSTQTITATGTVRTPVATAPATVPATSSP